MRLAEVAGPGAGLRTCRAILPGSVRVSVAVSCASLLKVVEAGTPFMSTVAPLMNLLPVTTTVAEPTLKIIGAAVIRIGMGFMTAMFWLMETVGSSTLIAVNITILFGV